MTTGVPNKPRRLQQLAEWADHRTGLETAVKNFLYENIPASSGWHQVFGSVAAFLFLVQAFTEGFGDLVTRSREDRVLIERDRH
jgi:quinol-cytochrome oxidoreductase complex cytochrome b subunit